MQENERQILRQFAVDLKRDIIPIDILPHLWCLTEDDCESIQYKQDREGPRAAVPILLERLKKRKGAFNQLLTALERTGCPHLKTLLQNAMEDQTPHPEHEHNSSTITPETSNVGSASLKTPTTETARPFSDDSSTKTMQPLKSVPSKRANKTPKKKIGQIPKENTTSPSATKTYTNTKTKPLKSQPPLKSSKTQQITKCSTKSPQKPICTSAKTDPETDFPENPTTHFDTLLCYAKENCEIALELKQFLETRCALTVCIDLFNFVPGKATTDNICESINSSQSIIFLLSPEFLRKLWAPWELKNAVYDFNASQKCGKFKKIIPVLLEECQVPEELKIYTAITLGRSGSKKDAWKKVGEALLGRPFGVDDDDGDEDSVDDVDVSNDDGNNDEVDNDTDDVQDGYDDNHGDTNNGISEVGVSTDSSDSAVAESNNGSSYQGDVDDDVVGTGNEEDDDDGGSEVGSNDCIKDGSSCEDDDGSSDGVNDCGCSDHDEDVYNANNSSNDGTHNKDNLDGNHDDAGHDHVDNNDSDEAGDDKHLNQNACGIHDNGVGECDGNGDNNSVGANSENKDDNAYNNIKSL